jgi:hypothetical protein
VTRETLTQLPGVAPDTREIWRKRIDRYTKPHVYDPIIHRRIASSGGTLTKPITRSNFLRDSCNSSTLLARTNVRLISISISISIWYVAIRQAIAMIARPVFGFQQCSARKSQPLSTVAGSRLTAVFCC